MIEFKIALVQKKAFPNDLEKNLSLGLEIVAQAKQKGADLVLFPEMWSNGYAPPYPEAFDDPLAIKYEEKRKKWLSQAIDEQSEYVTSFQKCAKELEIGIVITYLSKGNKAPRNTATVINEKGELIMTYSKVHTCDFSLETLLESGEGFKVCEFKQIKIGVMICYDREFPESARILMLKGAEIILIPNACDMNPVRLNQLSTRAFENMVGVAMANYPGEKWGNSCAYSPIVFDEDGNYQESIIDRCDETEEIKVVSFKLEEIRKYRLRETWGNAFRKVNAYTELLNREVKEPFIR